jgi:Ax21 family sulfation-dependent quorum factor
MKRSLLALTLLAALPFAASAAEGLSYNYVEGGYTASNGDGDIDADGFGANASVAIHPNFHLFGGYSQQEVDDVDVDVDQWRAGVGYNLELSPKLDLIARAAYEKVEVESFDADGYSAEVGVRSPLTSRLEGYATAGYEDFGDDDGFGEGDGDFYGRVGAQVKFNQNWGIGGDVKVSDGNTQWFVGPRFSW